MKGVIISAGYGSRFFPVTKTVPKEMLPLYNIPSIHFAVAELMEAGIEDIIVVTSRRKKTLDDYFDVEFELETFFKGSGKEELIKPYSVNVCFVRQKRMMGVGNAILEASSFIGREPFILLYPDDIVISSPSLSKRLIDLHKVTGKSVLSLVNKSGEDVSRFGVVKVVEKSGFFEVEKVIEKPKPGEAPSGYIAIGRYLFTNELIELLRDEWDRFGGKGEFYHISSLNKLCSMGRVVGLEVDGKDFFDTGTPIEYSKAFIRFLVEHSEVRNEMKEWLRRYVERSL
ncbi:MAG: UTP--glucose-1-phosphate uridylyltransferase [Brevinematia bacterium]